MAAAGSAVGLGNLWRFPFITAQGGGGVFLLMYLLVTAFIGFTFLLIEMGLGKKMRSDPVGTMRAINPKFTFIGALGVFTPCVIVPYYSVVGSWIVYYLVESLMDPQVSDYELHFREFISSPMEPLVYLFLFIFISAYIVYRGIEKGIEKYSKIIMPMLFVLLLILMLRALTLENAEEGVRYFFYPDFSKATPETSSAWGYILHTVPILNRTKTCSKAHIPFRCWILLFPCWRALRYFPPYSLSAFR